jgi:glycosyl transferase family 25
MRIFIINLPLRTDKRAAILERTAALGLDAEIIEAVNGAQMTDDEIKTVAGDYPACRLTKGVIGCALSHLKIYKKMAGENIPVALVMEDDALPLPGLAEVLEDIEALDKNENAKVWLLSSHYYHSRRRRRLRGGRALHRFADGSQGHGYALNRRAAEALYKNLLPVKWEADKWYYFGQMGLADIDCVVPHAIAVDGSADKSDLYAERIILDKQRRAYLRKLTAVVGVRARLKKLLWKLFRRPFIKKS